MNYISIHQKYLEHGYKTLPTTDKKSPCVPVGQDWKEDLPESLFENSFGIGLKLGEASGFIECMDFDNHLLNAKNKLSEFLAIPEVKEIYDKHKPPIENTVSRGYHLLYRCLEMEGSRKLALQFKEDKTTDCFIETKGLASYICIDPTPGYKFIRNDLFNIPMLSKVERAILIDNAISMNEVFQTHKTEYEQTDRPGDLYNASMGAIGDMKGILQGIGWQDLGNYRWRRPGKKEGLSATLGKVAPNVFYVFTANSSPFEPNKAYTPFQVLALVKFNGDFKEAAKSVAPERVERVEVGRISLTELEKILLGAKIDTSRKIDRPPTILSFMDQQATSTIQKRVFTLGNFSCIIGKAKSKKTFFLSMVSSALLCNSTDGKFIGEMKEGKNEILYFDTEQGEYDSYNVIKRIELMAGTKERFRGYNLRPFSPVDRCQIIEYAFKLFGEKTGFCVIDGIADLANGINDEDEATRVVTILLRLSKVYNCHISTVIHQNKNNEFATGHLGSSIMKKAEIIISVNKRENDTSEITCDMSRGVGFESFDMYINSAGIPEISRGGAKKEPVRTYYEVKSADEIDF
jgi:hypothetical protein